MYATVLAFAFMIISLRTIATKILYNMFKDKEPQEWCMQSNCLTLLYIFHKNKHLVNSFNHTNSNKYVQFIWFTHV